MGSKAKGLIKGTVQGHHSGYGFVVMEGGGLKDIYIPSRHMHGAMHGDTVLCRVVNKNRTKPEGIIVKILKRSNSTIIGTVTISGRDTFVVPKDRRLHYNIIIPHKKAKGLKNNQIVITRITKYPTYHSSLEGEIEEVIGDASDPEIETDLIIRKYGIYNEFIPEAVEEANNIPTTISKEEIRNRLDLRNHIIITIDGENAKDFDDAISLEFLENRYILGVHIADVSHYVPIGSTLDKEAFRRANSVYFPDRVIPMLPKRLSNNICSLVPKADRLCLSLIIEFDIDGNILNYKTSPSIINSCEKMTYTKVFNLLKGGNDKLKERYLHILDNLIIMEKLCKILRRKRMEKGSIDFDLPEPEIILDMQGNPKSILRTERNIAHIIIEEFMLAANQLVATILSKSKILSIFRIHDRPDEEKILEFNDFIQNFGFSLKNLNKIKPIYLQQILEMVKGNPEEYIINYILLRSMKQAEYSTNNIGHFGLAFKYYTHFTSPIRRYPDLVVHRILKGFINHHKVYTSKQKLSEIAAQSSARERIAEEAEREIIKLMRVKFMQKRIGKIYAGIVSGVKAFGIFVELDEVFVEGLIHISKLIDDNYFYYEKDHMLKGINTNKRYRIGDRVIVRVDNIDIQKKQIDFSLAKGIKASTLSFGTKSSGVKA